MATMGFGWYVHEEVDIKLVAGLAWIPEENRAAELDLSAGELPAIKTLSLVASCNR